MFRTIVVDINEEHISCSKHFTVSLAVSEIINRKRANMLQSLRYLYGFHLLHDQLSFEISGYCTI
jgi:hypothetical protein